MSLPIALLLVLSLVGVASGCSCFASPISERLCEASFALVGRVIGEVSSDVDEDGNRPAWNPFSERKYTIQVDKVFKGNVATDGLGQWMVTTPNNDGMCGVRLEKGRTYLLGGFENSLNLCGVNELWSWVPVKVKNALGNGRIFAKCQGGL